MFGPLEQFDITIADSISFLSYDILFEIEKLTFFEDLICALFLACDYIRQEIFINDFFLMFLRVICIYIILTWLAYGYKNYIFPNRWAIFFEQIYNFLAVTFKEQVGYRGQVHFPFLSTIFFYIAIINLVGMIPYEGALSSQAVVALSLSFTVFFSLTLIGFLRQKINFLYVFIPPKGIPLILIPLLVLIEIVSYFSRGVSLGVRLFANIMAGHTLLFIFSSFIFSVNGAIGFSIFVIVFLITCLEFVIALLQAYVFFVLTLIYFRDSIEVSH